MKMMGSRFDMMWHMEYRQAKKWVGPSRVSAKYRFKVYLSWPTNSLGLLLSHFFPLRHPPHRSGHLQPSFPQFKLKNFTDKLIKNGEATYCMRNIKTIVGEKDEQRTLSLSRASKLQVI